MNLNTLRKKIDIIDKKLIALLKRRFLLAQKIGRFKIEKNLSVVDEKREEEIMEQIKKTELKKIFKLIIKESKKVQQNLP